MERGSKASRSIAVALLMALLALPAAAELSGTADVAMLPDEPTSPRQTMVRIAQASLMIGLTGLGLAITFTSLFSDRKR